MLFDAAKLNKVKNGKKFNWILIPGGPGIGSEYLANFWKQLNVEGAIWTFDITAPKENVEEWKKSLYKAVDSLSNVILVGHSFGGMLMQSIPEIETKCVGHILLDTAPTVDWANEAEKASQKIDISAAIEKEKEYNASPSDKLFMELCVSWIPYYFTPAYYKIGKDLFLKNSFNSDVYMFGMTNFVSTYCSKWMFSTQTPILCASGELDLITPIKLFRDYIPTKNDTIQLVEIPEAAHFPWVENFKYTSELIVSFQNKIIERVDVSTLKSSK